MIGSRAENLSNGSLSRIRLVPLGQDSPAEFETCFNRGYPAERFRPLLVGTRKSTKSTPDEALETTPAGGVASACDALLYSAGTSSIVRQSADQAARQWLGNSGASHSRVVPTTENHMRGSGFMVNKDPSAAEKASRDPIGHAVRVVTLPSSPWLSGERCLAAP